MLKPGIIVSIQQLSRNTIEELAREAISGGAVAIRTDKPINCKIPVIGLKKISVQNRSEDIYITPTLKDVRKVKDWAYLIAIDYRRINQDLKEISDFCRENNLCVVADIETVEDYENILENDYYYTFIATTFSIFHMNHTPDIELIRQLKQLDCKNIIAEGNYQTRKQVLEAYAAGANNVCIGSAISNVYKQTRKYTSVKRILNG
jgi:putative N-acetylmannosamine-6-phosphate epimerase